MPNSETPKNETDRMRGLRFIGFRRFRGLRVFTCNPVTAENWNQRLPRPFFDDSFGIADVRCATPTSCLMGCVLCTGCALVPELATLVGDDVVLDTGVVGLLHRPHAKRILSQEPRAMRVHETLRSAQNWPKKTENTKQREAKPPQEVLTGPSRLSSPSAQLLISR